MQSAYTSAIEGSLLKWNGRDFDSSMHYAIEFYCCHVTTFWSLIGTANFQAAEVTVWTRGSCQVVSPTTAWERGYAHCDMLTVTCCQCSLWHGVNTHCLLYDII